MDDLSNNFLNSPSEESARDLVRTVAKLFGDDSFTPTDFNKFQDLITHEKSNNLHYGGYSASDHFSNALRSYFKHNKRNDLIVHLKPTSVKKFTDIDSFGKDTVALINKNVLHHLRKSKNQKGGDDDDYYSSDFNFRSHDDRSVSSMKHISSEKGDPKEKLIGGSLESSEMDFVTFNKKNTKGKVPFEDEQMLDPADIKRRKSSGSIVKTNSFIKTNADMISKRKSYELRKKGNNHELSIYSSDVFTGGAPTGVNDSLAELEKIERQVDQLMNISDAEIEKSNATTDEIALSYPTKNVRISVFCFMTYLQDPLINVPKTCDAKILADIFDNTHVIKMKEYLESVGKTGDDKKDFLDKSKELYQFIIKFSDETMPIIDTYDVNQQKRMLVNLHHMITSYIEYVTQKVKSYSIVNDNLIKSAITLLELHNKTINKAVDEGTTIRELQKHLEEFYALSKENLDNVDNLVQYLSVGPKEAYDPLLLSEIAKRAKELNSKIDHLKAISKEMKQNIDALNEQLPHAGLTQTSLAEGLPNETIVTVPIDVSKEIMDKEAPKEIMDKTTLKEFVNEPKNGHVICLCLPALSKKRAPSKRSHRQRNQSN